MSKRALITGVLGQDGSYLSDLLIDKGYRVFGMIRRNSAPHYDRIEHLMNNPHFRLVSGDLADQISLNNLIKEIQPDEVYNLAAQSQVGLSFDQPTFTSDITGLGVLRILEAVKSYKPDAKFYQASSSEMFGDVRESPQTESTPFHPRSPYGVAKVYGHYITQNYRESYGMFTCSGILYNHESSRRGIEFVTRKITDAAARCKLGLVDKVGFGTLDTQRDWGHAVDFTYAMWLMLQQDSPDDYVIATGETHSVEEFMKMAFQCVELDYMDYIYSDPRYMRPADVNCLCGDYSKAKRILKWEPSTSFVQLVKLMVDADLQKYTKDR